MGIDVKLLDIVACPICKSKLKLTPDKNGLICAADKLVYPIESGIPVLLEDRAYPLQTHEAGLPK